MKIRVYYFITRSSISNISYSISVQSTFALLFFMGILLTSFIPRVISEGTEKIEEMCSCGLQTPQNKFCDHDFVIGGKRVNRQMKTFNRRGGENPQGLGNFRGEIYRIRVIYNFKGLFGNHRKNKSFVTIYILKGPGCGIPDTVEVKRHRIFIFSGYKYNNALIVTMCNWMQPLKEITLAQGIGLFQGFYQDYCQSSSRCQISFELPTRRSISRKCQIALPYKECYDKHAICQMRSTSTCSFVTDFTKISTKRLKENVPRRLLKNFVLNRVSTNFDYCRRLIAYNRHRP